MRKRPGTFESTPGNAPCTPRDAALAVDLRMPDTWIIGAMERNIMSEQIQGDGGPVAHLIVPRVAEVGGIPVRRALPSVSLRRVGPFVFLDQMGPASLPPGVGLDVAPHPHIGLSTLTWLFEGELLHRDSLGVVQRISPGEVNWMTAGHGVTHSERTPPEARDAGGRLHGLQFWVALPDGEEETEPSFSHHGAHELPLIACGVARMTLVAGEAFGERSPVPVRSALHLIDVQASAGEEIPLPGIHPEQGLYVVEGEVEIGTHRVAAGRFVGLRPSPVRSLTALTPARLALVGGEPLGSDRIVWWNFVARTKERLETAKLAWADDRFPPVPGETERIPLPQ